MQIAKDQLWIRGFSKNVFADPAHPFDAFWLSARKAPEDAIQELVFLERACGLIQTLDIVCPQLQEVSNESSVSAVSFVISADPNW